ncbi:hypothetical protein Phi47:1_gp70 [Cellulophaga phage phi47:1]|nr:hypothetical protein Phi3ST:2_gp70 [Cellulophaga phage phi3ST:2]AGO49309.1 hypothetical protein Phi38:2_gp70 [Cellulophaga phage phi38:2]AGO49807.1 hypothetical protein Phi47:1_gp70 [Cellulophaga phage phi47:1]
MTEIKNLINSALLKEWVSDTLFSSKALKDLEERIKLNPKLDENSSVPESFEEKLVIDFVTLATTESHSWRDMSTVQVMHELEETLKLSGGLSTSNLKLSKIRLGKALSKHERTDKRMKSNIRHFRIESIGDEEINDNQNKFSKLIEAGVKGKKCYRLGAQEIRNYLEVDDSVSEVEFKLESSGVLFSLVKGEKLYYIKSMKTIKGDKVYIDEDYKVKFKTI